MNKIMKRIVPILIVVMVLALPMIATAANGTISSLEAKSQGGTVTVSGKASDGVLSVAVFVYDQSGSNLVDVGSAVVNDDRTFTRKVELADGTYMVKVADYDGGAFEQALTNATPASTTVTVKSSKTADAVNPYLWIGILAGAIIVGGATTVIYKARRA